MVISEGKGTTGVISAVRTTIGSGHLHTRTKLTKLISGYWLCYIIFCKDQVHPELMIASSHAPRSKIGCQMPSLPSNVVEVFTDQELPKYGIDMQIQDLPAKNKPLSMFQCKVDFIAINKLKGSKQKYVQFWNAVAATSAVDGITQRRKQGQIFKSLNLP